MKGRQRELGEDHPDTLETKNDMAILDKEQGDLDKSEPLLVEALEGRRLKLGDTHLTTPIQSQVRKAIEKLITSSI